MTRASFEDVLATNVPDNELAFAQEHLEGARIEQAPLSPELVDKHADARVLACMIHDPIEPATLKRFEALEGIVTRSDGYDHLPAEWMAQRSIPGCHLEGYATSSVAQHTLMFILTLLRRVPEGQATALGNPPTWERGHLLGRHLTDVTVGVLGVGRIGSTVARQLTSLGAKVLGYDIEPDPGMRDVEGFRFVDTLEDLLEASDVLTVHVPLDGTTRGLVDGGALDRLPDDAVLVNTARGDIVDQEAVEVALELGTLAGYAADVMPGEPDPPDLTRFQRFENVVVTPHLAAYDVRTTDERYRTTAEAVRAILEGDEAGIERLRVI